MELTPKEQAEMTYNSYVKEIYSSMDDVSGFGTCAKGCSQIDIQGKIDLLSKLNQTKMCKFDKEIDYWNEVLKELDNL